jgi:alpha-1,4-digalacturonate transport system substrate-binding protein
MDEQVGDFFDWQVVGSPCGPAGACSGMPGGAGIVGFEQTEHPEIVANVIDFLAQEDVYAEVTARTRNLPAHLGVAEAGVEFEDASPQAAAALSAFAADLPDVAPAAFQYQGYAGNRAMFGITVERVSQAIVGEITVDEAVARMADDLAAAEAE